MTDALVLGGAVAKGAFAAGAVAEIRRRIPLALRRIVGSSSGALSAAFLAAAPDETERLVDLWVHGATWRRALAPDFRSIASRRGFSSGARIREFVESVIPERDLPGVDLRIIATDAAGTDGRIGVQTATTFERVVAFDAPRFRGEERESIIDAVLASAAFPFLYAPNGTLLDGGALDNTPIKHALGRPCDAARVFVIAPYPRILRAEDVPPLHGISLASHLADMMVHERLFRDLREADSVNRALRRLRATCGDETESILGALGWSGRREVEIIEVRPTSPLPGSAFAGFFDEGLRREYVALGARAAAAALEARAAA